MFRLHGALERGLRPEGDTREGATERILQPAQSGDCRLGGGLRRSMPGSRNASKAYRETGVNVRSSRWLGEKQSKRRPSHPKAKASAPAAFVIQSAAGASAPAACFRYEFPTHRGASAKKCRWRPARLAGLGGRKRLSNQTRSTTPRRQTNRSPSRRRR